MSAQALPPFRRVRPKMITHHVFNERMAERGRAEAKRTALVQTLQQGADLKANAEGLMRAQNLQRRNVAAMKSAEQMFGREFEERTEFDRRKQRDEDQQAALAQALGEQKQEQLRWQNKLAQICENDPGLRSLQSQLKAAYMNQERAAQQEERRLVTQEELARERSLDQAMERDRQMALAEMSQKNTARKMIAAESREILTKQIAERRYAAEVEGLKAFENDKRMVDDIVRKVREDDRRETALRLEKQAETRAYIKRFQVERDVQLEDARRAADEEEAKIEAYRKEREGRGKAAAAKKAAKQAGRSQVQGDRAQGARGAHGAGGARKPAQPAPRRGELEKAGGRRPGAQGQARADEDGDDRGERAPKGVQVRGARAREG